VGAIHDSPGVADLVHRLKAEYEAARLDMIRKLAALPAQDTHA
jgi:hypothetical protein